MTDRCLTILSYTIAKDGVDIPALSVVHPSLTQVDDDIQLNGAVGTQLTYKLKARNQAGFSVYSEELTITVGFLPSQPLNLVATQMISESEVQLTWDKPQEILSNPAILAYKIYLDDGSGNQASMVYSTSSKSLTNVANVRDLIVGHVYNIFVTAMNELGESSPSNELTVHAGVEPSQIEFLEWETSTTTSVTIRW